jgi:hypothetical protein
MVGLVYRSILGMLAVLAVAALLAVTPAFAAEPWLQLSSTVAPATVQPGQAKNEVQQLTVNATGGEFVLVNPANFNVKVFKWDATHEEVQAGLEEMYGAGNVEVSGGPGDETGAKPYRIEYTGKLASQPVNPILAGSISLDCTGATGSGCTNEVTVKKIVEGRSDGVLTLILANMGDADFSGAETPVSIADKLPPGLTAASIIGHSGSVFEHGPVECVLESLTCKYTGSIPPYEVIRVKIGVNVSQGAKSGEPNEVSASGGNAPPIKATRPVMVGDASAVFGVEDYEIKPEEEGGAVDAQAGSHPFQLTTTLNLNRSYDATPALAKDLNFRLPPGLIGNPAPLPRCSLKAFLHAVGFVNECPNNTALGVANVTIVFPEAGGQVNEQDQTVPLFNLVPSVGEPARFGFDVKNVPVFLDTSVRTGGDYGVTVSVKNITQTAIFMSSRVTFWGVPGDPRHDNARGYSCLSNGAWHSARGSIPACEPLGQPLPPAFLELPTSCTGPLQTTIEADSWAQEGSFTATGPSSSLPSMDGCNALPLTPSLSVAPDSEAGDTPTGLTVGIHVPQEVSLAAQGLGEADVRNTTVVLPRGVALNPAAADGLQACSEAQVALQSRDPVSCPDASKVATVEIKTPLLPNVLTGELYLAEQNANPFGSLVALYLVAQDPVSGTVIKLAGEVVPDAVTGQLVSTFKDTPQLPFEDLKIHFFGGARAPLATPSLCGPYTTTSSIEGWSGNPASTPDSTFQIVSGPNSTPCRSPRPFSPSLTAGSTNIQAGAFSPFKMTVSREDGQQPIKTFQLHMPPGVSGLLTGVKLCGETEANNGTCGPESLIGETIVSVGVGGDPFSVRGGRVYITGPYEGAPFGVSVVVPAKAGPYDFGNVIVRGTIQVDPATAALTVTIDSTGPYKIPTILDGIPLQIRHINFTTTRSGFTFNPTDCDAMSVTASMSSTEGATVPLSVPFQVTNCATLKFAPKFAVSTSGKTSKAKGASLSVKLTYPKAPFGSQANIKSVKVDLPKQLPSRLTTLQKACTAAQFERNPANCPKESFIGHAKATTPLIPVPLEGPAIFVSHGGEAFPSLIIVLQGYGVTLDLVGSTFISKTGITSSTFKTVPDAPVGSFELTLPEGKFSALAANGDLCASTLTMPTEFLAQNGTLINQNTPVSVTGCAKKKALTRAQKLAAALKACKKKSKAKRAACQASAHRRYGPSARKKTNGKTGKKG